MKHIVEFKDWTPEPEVNERAARGGIGYGGCARMSNPQGMERRATGER